MNIFRNFFKKLQVKQNLKNIKPYILYPDTKIQYITEFKDGYALALIAKYDVNKCLNDNNLSIAVLDINYEVAFYTSYHSSGKWHNGYLIASADRGYVLLDKNLKEVPNLIFPRISINGNYFQVYTHLIWSQSGLLDENLQLVLPILYSSITSISETRFFCIGSKNIVGVKNVVFDTIQNKTFEVDIAYEIFYEDENGLYKFSGRAFKFGYFDNNFNVIAEPKYQSLGIFDKNGYAPFTRDGITGVIDRTGKEIIR